MTFQVVISLLVAVLFLLVYALWRIGILRHQLNYLRDRVFVFGSSEFHDGLKHSLFFPLTDFAESLAVISERLETQFKEVVHQRNEYQAVLRSMREGLVAVDAGQRIISINPMAGQLLGIEAPVAVGTKLEEVCRIYAIQKLCAQTLVSEPQVVEDVRLCDSDSTILEVRSAPLLDGAGKRIGVLLVLSDVTQVRRLEKVRQDFVANVSHELRTPLTAVRGFVETLQDGAIDTPGDARPILEIIARQVHRLGLIIENLLDLTRFEYASENGLIERRETSPHEVVCNAVRSCADQALRLAVRVDVKPPTADVPILANADLLEQAIVNLIDNALKFSPAGSNVTVYFDNDPPNEVSDKGSGFAREIAIHVTDRGCGIPQSHIDRIFERFYRVDKGRSRRDGGVGLGLAIAKHIVIAHGGRIAVESKLGEGSTFTIFLPSSSLPALSTDPSIEEHRHQVLVSNSVYY